MGLEENQEEDKEGESFSRKTHLGKKKGMEGDQIMAKFGALAVKSDAHPGFRANYSRSRAHTLAWLVELIRREAEYNCFLRGSLPSLECL